MREAEVFRRIPFTEPPTEEQMHKARRTVCGNATDPGDAETLLRMLGLIA